MASTVAAFLERKDIEVTFQRYAIDALSAMAQGLFASLLIGTILSTVGDLSGLAFFNQIGTFAKSVAGPAMAIAIGYALHTPPLVLFSLAAVGFAANDAGGAGVLPCWSSPWSPPSWARPCPRRRRWTSSSRPPSPS